MRIKIQMFRDAENEKDEIEENLTWKESLWDIQGAHEALDRL